jgi:23S rRNA (adenine2030-N6)-methyltransferase
MLSYQHAYHAGNAADVHKHVALVMVLRHLAAKEKPFSFIDTHAGRGLYDLESPEAHRTREAEGGVLRLAAAEGLAEPVRDYLTIVAGHNRRGAIRFYPGSAAIARAVLRDADRASLLELHPQESAALRQFVASDPRFSLHVRDCYEALPGLLPPTIRRGLVLIDPSYEVKSEYEDIVRLLDRALRRWANGIYLLWYPLLPGRRDRLLLRQLAKLAPPKVLVSEYSFSASSDRLQGSGLIVVNPPWQFENELTAAMQSVVDALGIGTHSVRAQPL